MFEARVIEPAVSLASIHKVNHTFRLRAGQLLVELVARGRSQWPFALAGYVQQGTLDFCLKPRQAVTAEVFIQRGKRLPCHTASVLEVRDKELVERVGEVNL